MPCGIERARGRREQTLRTSAPEGGEDRRHVGRAVDAMDRAGERGVGQLRGRLASPVRRVAPDPTPAIEEGRRIALQLPPCRSHETGPPRQVEPDHHVGRLESFRRHRPVVARDDPALAPRSSPGAVRPTPPRPVVCPDASRSRRGRAPAGRGAARGVGPTSSCRTRPDRRSPGASPSGPGARS